eukprot:5254057-Pleurochrysis_carterae.AAC.3
MPSSRASVPSTPYTLNSKSWQPARLAFWSLAFAYLGFRISVINAVRRHNGHRSRRRSAHSFGHYEFDHVFSYPPSA